MSLKKQVSWDMMLCWLINIHQYLRGACCFQLQDTSSPEP